MKNMYGLFSNGNCISVWPYHPTSSEEASAAKRAGIKDLSNAKVVAFPVSQRFVKVVFEINDKAATRIYAAYPPLISDALSEFDAGKARANLLPVFLWDKYSAYYQDENIAVLASGFKYSDSTEARLGEESLRDEDVPRPYFGKGETPKLGEDIVNPQPMEDIVNNMRLCGGDLDYRDVEEMFVTTPIEDETPATVSLISDNARETVTGDVRKMAGESAKSKAPACAGKPSTTKGAADATSPKYYSRWKIQPLKFCRDNGIDFLRGNCIKYLLRHDAKNGLEDLRKAFVYLMQEAKRAYGEEGCREILKAKWDICDNLEEED